MKKNINEEVVENNTILMISSPPNFQNPYTYHLLPRSPELICFSLFSSPIVVNGLLATNNKQQSIPTKH